jgi:predicted Zn-dependent protease
MRHVAALGLALLAGCAVPQMPAPAPSGRTEAPVPAAPSQSVAATAPSSERARVLAGNFFAAVDRVLPVAERTCREETRDLNCDFAIVVDDRPGLPPNAFQTLDPNGRPVIGFTLSLIAQADNQDELAFIIGHETAHHIAGHLARSRNSAILGASIAGVLARVGGADAAVIRSAQDIGANVGARRYSKSFELEADSLGTVIAARAGYDPVRGSLYFNRSPDPGNAFLGTHPPNAERLRVVRETAAGLRGGG